MDIVPKWNISDPDAGDIVTFTDIQFNSAGRFKIDKKTGRLIL